ncbi:MAG: metal ABC transporter ATP-binding protein [Megasphaera sp.]|jgi:zinc transport system ATP-binding protein|nr:metal ABC transporter ATP-binding protein [Megasphaera sp.]MCH4218529.1 metal ABC transporter ATP-binding protein [Megasphaera sp.]
MIELQHVYYAYEAGSPYLLRDLNLVIHDGDYISIVGENGSGKSTFVKLLLGLFKPSKGKLVNDFKRVSYVPQRFETLNSQFPITVWEVMDCYRRVIRIKDKKQIKKYLQFVGMEDHAEDLIGNLSGGQCQKVFIARALMAHPDLIILDEPSTGIDVKSQAELYPFLKVLNEEHGITVVTVEHNLRAAMRNSTYMYHVAKGSGHLCSPEEYIHEYVSENTGSESYV